MEHFNSQKKNATAILRLIYSLAFIQGLTIQLMPILFRAVGGAFHVGMARQGQLQSAFFLGMMLVGLWGGPLFDRLGAINTGIASLLLLSAGAFTIAISPAHWILLVGGTLFGIGNAWLTVVYSAPIARLFEDRQQRVFTWALMFMALGGMVGPVALGLALDRIPNWRLPLVGMTLLLLFVCVALWRFRGPEWNLDTPVTTSAKRSSLGILRKPRLWLTGFLFILHGLGGGILVAWIGRYYQQMLGISDDRIGLLLSVNAGGFMLGRLILGAWISGKLADRVLLSICAGGASIAYALLLLGRNYLLALALIGLEGLLMCGDAPSISSLTARQFPFDTAAAFALVQAMSGIGSVTAPWLVGMLGEKFGLSRAIWFGPAFVAILALFSIGWEMYDRGRLDHGGLAPAPSREG